MAFFQCRTCRKPRQDLLQPAQYTSDPQADLLFDGLAPWQIVQSGIILYSIISRSLVQPVIGPWQTAGKPVYTDDFFHQDVVSVFITKHFSQWIQDLCFVSIFIVRQKDIFQHLMLQQGQFLGSCNRKPGIDIYFIKIPPDNGLTEGVKGRDVGRWHQRQLPFCHCRVFFGQFSGQCRRNPLPHFSSSRLCKGNDQHFRYVHRICPVQKPAYDTFNEHSRLTASGSRRQQQCLAPAVDGFLLFMSPCHAYHLLPG